MSQKDQERVRGNGAHALVAVEGPAVSPTVVAIGTQQPVVAVLALGVLVGDVAS